MKNSGMKLPGETAEALRYTPLITVITVVYNAEKVLEPTILSVLNQDYTNIEYIIIDGASTDGTSAIIKKYEDKIAYHISEADKGIYDAMNKGIDAAKGDFIYFLGAGDVLLNIIHQIVPKMTAKNTLYYGDVYRTDLLRIYDGKFSVFKLAVDNICHQAIFYPFAALKKYKYNTKYKIQADHDLNMRCYGDKDIPFKYLPVVICIYEGAGFSEANADKPFFRDKMDIVRKNFPFIVFWYALTRRMLAKVLKNKDYSA